ncbi:hypothetical protein CI682_01955, partial [Klebsiella pneumoniae subsp. pneumoniae]
YSAIDQIAQFGLSSLKVIYYSEQLFRLREISRRCTLCSYFLDMALVMALIFYLIFNLSKLI